MENRRQDYRHTFAPNERPSVLLESLSSQTSLEGEIDNLSTEGMRIRFAEKVELPSAEQLMVTFVLPLPTGLLTIKSAVVYSLSLADDGCCGIHFLSSGNSESDLFRERTIWRFLTEEQRKFLRSRRQAGSK
jgi:hypothetical protein